MIAPAARPAGHENGAALALAWRRVIGPGFALPRDARRRPAFQAVPAIAPSALRALKPIRTVGVRSRLHFHNNCPEVGGQFSRWGSLASPPPLADPYPAL